MSTISITTPRTMSPVMPRIGGRQPHVPPAAAAVPSRLRSTLKAVVALAAASMLAALVLHGVSHLDRLLDGFTANSIGVIRSQHVPAAEAAVPAAPVVADPSTTVRSASGS